MLTLLLVVLLCAHRLVAEPTYALISWGFDSEVEPQILKTDVLDAYAGHYALAAITKGGHVRTWGSPEFGADFNPTSRISNIARIVAAEHAFAGITKQGQVVAWGSQLQGGDLSSTDLASPSTFVDDVVSSARQFAAIKRGGNVSYWGLSQGQNLILFEDVRDRLVDVIKIVATQSAFAAIKNRTGEVVTWGDGLQGGVGDNAHKVKDNVIDIFTTEAAFAALKNTGEVVVWGEPNSGGELPDIESMTTVSANITKVFSNAKAFVAIKSNGQVVTWGDRISGGDSSSVKYLLESQAVHSVSSTDYAFAALMADGQVVTWGNDERGGDSSSVRTKLRSGVISIANTKFAFAALRNDGEVIAWGDAARGGDSSLVSAKLVTGVVSVVGNIEAFAAVKKDGEVVVWGSASSGGQIPSEISPKLKSRADKIVSHPHGNAFAALICLPNIIENEFECARFVRCPADQIWNGSKLECEACSEDEVPDAEQMFCTICEKNGTVPANNGSACISCNPNEIAIAGLMTHCMQCESNEVPLPDKSDCTLCALGKVPSVIGDECIVCEGGFIPNGKGHGCVECESGSYAKPGDASCTSCDLGWILSTDGDGEGCGPNLSVILPILTVFVLVLICMRQFFKQSLNARQVLKDIREVDKGDIQKMKAIFERAREANFYFGRARKARDEFEKQLIVQQNRYTNLDALRMILDEGHLKMVHAYVITETGDRMMRQQDISTKLGGHGKEPFWTGRRLFQRDRMTATIAVSYCWCHPVHPDPRGDHLRILRHATKLRLDAKGKGFVQDLAVFLDFMCMAQNGEAGSKEHPIPGVQRTDEELASFRKALAVVNIPYACQLVETWIIAWVPPGVQNTYEERAWPTFERNVSSLVKDANKLVSLSDETLWHTHPDDLYALSSLRRVAPQTPERFNEIIVKKNVTSGKDVDFLKSKYKQTFEDVIGHGKTLWFANLSWTDTEADELCEIFQHCHVLVTVILSGNSFSTEAAKNLVEASKACKTLQKMDLADNHIDENDFDILKEMWIQLGKKESGLTLANRRDKYNATKEEDGVDDEQTMLIGRRSSWSSLPADEEVTDHAPAGSSRKYFGSQTLGRKQSGAMMMTRDELLAAMTKSMVIGLRRSSGQTSVARSSSCGSVLSEEHNGQTRRSAKDDSDSLNSI